MCSKQHQSLVTIQNMSYINMISKYDTAKSLWQGNKLLNCTAIKNFDILNVSIQFVVGAYTEVNTPHNMYKKNNWIMTIAG